MAVSLYMDHPIYLLYYAALKKGVKLEHWKDIMCSSKFNDVYPYSVAVNIIEKYGNEQERD